MEGLTALLEQNHQTTLDDGATMKNLRLTSGNLHALIQQLESTL